MEYYHVVEQGECLASIARDCGFTDWRKIYHHPANSELRQRRSNPNVLHPGDRLFIPQKTAKEEECETDARHSFVLAAPKTLLHVVLKDACGQAIAGKKYRLLVGRHTYEGSTGDDGAICRRLPANEQQGTLVVWLAEGHSAQPCTIRLKIGHLDPVEELTGLQARLENLGYSCGVEKGPEGTVAAVRAFQEANGLKVDGVAGHETQTKLVELHGC